MQIAQKIYYAIKYKSWKSKWKRLLNWK